MDDDYERVLLVKQECFVYRLPPRPSTSRGYRASEWGLDSPQWTGRMRITTMNKKVEIKLEDKSGQLFASAPVETFPGIAVEPVTDSSRYFVLRVADGSGRTAFLGAGFADRGDAFDFNMALQDHFNHEKSVTELTTEQPKLDLGLKAGQTISIKLGNTSTTAKPRSRPKVNAGGVGGILLPPPPTAAQIKPPQQAAAPPSVSAPQSNADTEWGQFSSSSSTNKDWVTF